MDGMTYALLILATYAILKQWRAISRLNDSVRDRQYWLDRWKQHDVILDRYQKATLDDAMYQKRAADELKTANAKADAAMRTAIDREKELEAVRALHRDLQTQYTGCAAQRNELQAQLIEQAEVLVSYEAERDCLLYKLGRLQPKKKKRA